MTTSRLPPIESVMVVGFGVMGRGIALSFARAGFRTAVLSRRRPEEIGPVPEGVAVLSEPDGFAPDLVIEAVPEDVAIKRAVFERLERTLGDRVLIATNTSGLPLEVLSEPLRRPERFLATHYFMPAEVFPMVEVVSGPATEADALERVCAAMRRTGKEPILLRKPVIGFIINRLQHAILHEAYHLIEQGIASPETLDEVARRLIGPRFCVNGLIEQKDIGGLAPHAAGQRSIVPTLEHSGVPNRFLQAMVARGEVGLDRGLGFYDWSGCDPEAVRRASSERLERLARFLDEGLGERDPLTRPGPRPRAGAE